MSVARCILLAISAAVLAACGGVPVAEVKATLASSRPCCVGYDTVPTATLISGARFKFELTTSSPVFTSSVGPAYFAGFKLPSNTRSLLIQALNTGYLPKATYPDPLIVFLDQAKSPITAVQDLPLVHGRHSLFPGVYEYYYGATVAVPMAAEYVVVFANAQSGRQQLAISENGTHWPVLPAPVGTIALVPNEAR